MSVTFFSFGVRAFNITMDVSAFGDGMGKLIILHK